MENRLHEDDGTDRVDWLAGNSGHILEESRIDVARQQGWVSRTSQTSNPKVTDPARLKQGFLCDGRNDWRKQKQSAMNEQGTVADPRGATITKIPPTPVAAVPQQHDHTGLRNSCTCWLAYENRSSPRKKTANPSPGKTIEGNVIALSD